MKPKLTASKPLFTNSANVSATTAFLNNPIQNLYRPFAKLSELQKKDISDLVFEHMVPKEEYIQKPCKEAAKMVI